MPAQPLPKAHPSVTLWGSEAMRGFRCLGTECEATCCIDWQVPVDKQHYFALKKAMDGTRAGREEFRATHTRVRDGASDERYALMVVRDDGHCAMLDGDRLCRIHKRHGEPLLADICSSYPYFVSAVGDHLEATLRLSCPEVARRALLEDEPATPHLVPASAIGRLHASYRVDPGATFYLRPLLDVRDAALGLLALERFPLATRMFLLAYLGQRTAPFLRTGVDRDVGAEVAAEIARLERPEVQDELARQLADLPVPEAMAAVVVLCMLEARLENVQPGFRDLVARALAGYLPRDAEGRPQTADGAQVMAAYRHARATTPPALAARMDEHLARFARLQLIIRPYAVAPDLLTYVQDLAMRLAVVRLLLVGHPGSREAAAAPDGSDEQRRLIDAAAVDVIFRFSRAVDHGTAFLSGIHARIEGEGLVGFPWTVALTRF